MIEGARCTCSGQPLSPPRKRGSGSAHIELDSRFRGNDRHRVIFGRADTARFFAALTMTARGLRTTAGRRFSATSWSPTNLKRRRCEMSERKSRGNTVSEGRWIFALATLSALALALAGSSRAQSQSTASKSAPASTPTSAKVATANTAPGTQAATPKPALAGSPPKSINCELRQAAAEL